MESGRRARVQTSASSSSSSSSSHIKLETSSSSSSSSSSTASRLSSSCLSLYNQPPTHEITLAEFEQSGADRLSLLQWLEAQRAKKSNFAYEPDWPFLFRAAAQKYRLWQNTERDQLSHHVLRLAYCLTEESRRWIVGAECALFRCRFELETEDVIAEFLVASGLDAEFTTLSAEEFHRLKPRLTAASSSPYDLVGGSTLSARDFHRVPFEDALDLVKERKVLLENGYAFVSRANLVHILTARFKANLTHQLAASCRVRRSGASPASNDVRLTPLLSMLGKQGMAVASYSNSVVSGAVKLSDLPALLSSASMPLCMSAMYQELQRSHHLKHTGRVTFNLFLKGIGLSMQDALSFWKSSMARRTAGDKFEKEYAYGVRHGYGKEGKRADYTPYSCMKIIQTQSNDSSKGAGECSGCPFKTSDDRALKAALTQRGVPPTNMEEVLKLVHDSHYQVACQRVFQATHSNGMLEGVGTHPNAYFDASQRLLRGESSNVKKEEVKKEDESNPSQPSQSKTQPASSSSPSPSSSFANDDGPVPMVLATQPVTEAERQAIQDDHEMTVMDVTD